MKKLVNYRLSASDLYYVALVMYISANHIQKLTTVESVFPQINFIANIASIVALILLVIKELFRLKSDTSYIKYIFLVILFLGIALHSGRSYLFVIIIFVISSRDIEYTNILKIFFSTQLVIFILIVFAGNLHFIPNIVYFGASRTRYALGYIYSTFSAHLLMYLSLTYVAIRKSKINILELVVMLLFCLFIYQKTQTRNPAILTFILICGTLIIKYHEGIVNNRLIIFFTRIFYGIMFILSIVLPLLYKQQSKYFFILNNILSGRLKLGLNAIQTYGITLFGKNITLYGNYSYLMGNVPYGQEYNYIDSSYLQYLIIYGVIVTIVIMIFFTKIVIDATKTNNFYLVLVLLLSAIHSFFDPQLIIIWYTPFVLLTFSYKYTVKKEKGNEANKKLSV